MAFVIGFYGIDVGDHERPKFKKCEKVKEDMCVGTAHLQNREILATKFLPLGLCAVDHLDHLRKKQPLRRPLAQDRHVGAAQIAPSQRQIDRKCTRMHYSYQCADDMPSS